MAGHSPSASLTAWPGSVDCPAPQLCNSAASLPSAAGGLDPNQPVPAQHCSWTCHAAQAWEVCFHCLRVTVWPLQIYRYRQTAHSLFERLQTLDRAYKKNKEQDAA